MLQGADRPELQNAKWRLIPLTGISLSKVKFKFFIFRKEEQNISISHKLFFNQRRENAQATLSEFLQLVRSHLEVPLEPEDGDVDVELAIV